ncbi:unnamed protein product [Protopolystoma xenopodis]|uniref:Uncharacterized protein n=1 Tax=Protopolystoma xenopodis TaxID=117903 RepID=A0A448WKQ3_9PLAT|nr:unnamed protein product [Protopolystoma xenopodis]
MFIFYNRCALLANLPLHHRIRYLPCFLPFRVADPALVSCPDPLHGPVGPFLIFLADRFHSVPASAYFYFKYYFSSLQ